MNYKQFIIDIAAGDERDLLIASLEQIGFEGFEEKDRELIAYIPDDSYNEGAIATALTKAKYQYTINEIVEQNWNQLWEENFEPVIVGDFCTVRADFHTLENKTEYD